MKNFIIVALVLIVAGMGYILFTKEDSSSPDSDLSTSIPTPTATPAGNEAQAEKPAASNGKTIDLSSKGLTQIDKDILDDSSVGTLDVSGNSLTGALPGEIRKLTNLEVLDASDNNMTGIPAEIGQLSKLRVANFANNNITGLPNEIGNLKNLETLDLRGNPNVSNQDLSLIKSKIPKANVLTD